MLLVCHCGADVEEAAEARAQAPTHAIRKVPPSRPPAPGRARPAPTVDSGKAAVRQLARPQLEPEQELCRSRSRNWEKALSALAPRRVPASAGARHFRARRHLPLLVLQHSGKQTELDARCANPPPPLPLARALATPPAPRTDPAPSGRLAYCPRAACTLASSPPPLLPLCAGARHCLLSPDAASPPMPPRPRCRRCPLAPMPPPMPPRPRCRPRCRRRRRRRHRSRP